MPSRKTVGLVLGSGSTRGWAHIGVIEALEEEKIPIDYVAGCSIGSYYDLCAVTLYTYLTQSPP